MKPFPALDPDINNTNDSVIPSIPSALNTPTGYYSKSNRRSPQRAYPWLLATSTGVALVFCLLYITRPVIMVSQDLPPGDQEKTVLPKMIASVTTPAKSTGMMPDHDRLPGEKASPNPKSAASRETTAPANPSAAPDSAFEQTNIRIQHILTAEAPGGHLAKIDLDVPVLYQSRNIRWTAAEVAEARELLTRLSDYQEKSRMLRAEGLGLLGSWNHLMERSIPAGALRADSPTLPTNQQDAADTPRPAGLNTTESVKLQPAVK